MRLVDADVSMSYVPLGEAKKIPVFATGVTETDLRTPVREM